MISAAKLISQPRAVVRMIKAYLKHKTLKRITLAKHDPYALPELK